MPQFTITTASTIYLLLLTITNPTSAFPKPNPQFSSPSNNPSPLFAPEAPPPPSTNTYLQDSHSNNNNNNNNDNYNNYDNNENTENTENTENYPTSNDLQRARPFRNTNEVELEFTTAQNIMFTESVTLNERGYGSLALDDVTQVHHNHDGNRITAARITRSPINFPTLECFLRVDGLERDRSLLAAWGGAGGAGPGGAGPSDDTSGNYRRGSRSGNNDNSDTSGAGRNYEEMAYTGAAAESDSYNDLYNSPGSGGDGSRGRIYAGDEVVDQYGYRGSGYGDEESRVEKLALLYRYPPIPFDLEPSTYFLASTVHCISR